MATSTRERLLETTSRLLLNRGYHGTSLNDILADSGAPRGSLYFHFPGGKDQLVIEATRRSVDEVTAFMRDCFARSRDPGEAVYFQFEGIVHFLEGNEYEAGCPVSPVILDAAGGVPELADLARDAILTWISILRENFIAAGIPAERAAVLAELVEACGEGLLVMGRGTRDTDRFLSVGLELQALVRAALPEETTVAG